MDTHDRSARKAKLTLAGLAVLAAAGLVGGGVVAYSLFGNDGSEKGAAGPTATAKPGPSGSGPDSGGQVMTPEKKDKLLLSVPTGQKDGVSTGFPHSARGAVSAAVYFWEEYAWLDDQKARQQLGAVVSPDATGYVDQEISEIRKGREAANLPSSGGTPAGLTINTIVEAVRPKSITLPGATRGDVVQIWMSFDRYATTPEKATDDNPMKGDTVDFIVKWQDGAWKLTNEPKYWQKRSFPLAYAADSPYASRDGWVQVRHAD
ncbi:hypothetical protein PUR34_14335 [Streptomyces sp. JV185]|uniref:hypothetical protein n=1 Tax=Streptomyces sp. JV185 TaxID=858638 RepID=UPI002E7A61C1|nr:hypothetical protein [Streptomyces sp. JV185]MEE1769297.1 hypothetical protein [Streptomyces sp. JV185]